MHPPEEIYCHMETYIDLNATVSSYARQILTIANYEIAQPIRHPIIVHKPAIILVHRRCRFVAVVKITHGRCDTRVVEAPKLQKSIKLFPTFRRKTNPRKSKDLKLKTRPWLAFQYRPHFIRNSYEPTVSLLKRNKRKSEYNSSDTLYMVSSSIFDKSYDDEPPIIRSGGGLSRLISFFGRCCGGRRKTSM